MVAFRELLLPSAAMQSPVEGRARRPGRDRSGSGGHRLDPPPGPQPLPPVQPVTGTAPAQRWAPSADPGASLTAHPSGLCRELDARSLLTRRRTTSGCSSTRPAGGCTTIRRVRPPAVPAPSPLQPIRRHRSRTPSPLPRMGPPWPDEWHPTIQVAGCRRTARGSAPCW